MKTLLRSVSVLACLFAVSCSSHDNDRKTGTSPAMMNKTCPMTGEALDASSPTVDYNGGKVGFCCERCMGKWNAMTPAEQKAKLDGAR